MNRHGLRALLHAWRSAQARDATAVLATVIHTEGSSYRKPGARMLIETGSETARVTGIVGGGCFDDDLLEHARAVVASGQARIQRYDMTADDDVLWGLGMGCNGLVDVFLQPLDDRGRHTLELLARQVESGGPLATQVRSGANRVAGESWIPDADPGVGGSALASGGAIFVDQVPAPFHLGVFGAGSDTLPVLELADQLDWQVQVWDHRPGRARPDRFPTASAVTAFDGSAPDGAARCDAILVMSHSFEADQRFLQAIAGLETPYVGVLGPAARRERLLEQIGEPAASALRARLRGPVGLDLGGDLPEEVALSAVAQIQGFRHGGSAAALDAAALRPSRAVGS